MTAFLGILHFHNSLLKGFLHPIESDHFSPPQLFLDPLHIPVFDGRELSISRLVFVAVSFFLVFVLQLANLAELVWQKIESNWFPKSLFLRVVFQPKAME